MARIVLAMSGGVDSSVSAHLLRQAGHDVIGVFMRHGEPVATACATEAPTSAAQLPIVAPRAGHKQGCCTAGDAADARRVADMLDIPFYALDFHDEFGRIIDYFVEEYTAARTPNPCVACNNWLKFGKLFDYADGVGADYVATGHYARLTVSPSSRDVPAPNQPAQYQPAQYQPALLRGRDDAKDQSYVLFGIDRRLLRRMLLPVGDFRKDEIRQIARDMGLRVADKKDSQEICFVPDGDHAAFIRGRQKTPDAGGDIVTTNGQVVGHHDGLAQFTIGQRKGLGVALGEPRFVVRLEHDTRRVIIGTRQELARDRLTASRVNWLADEPRQPIRCLAKIRYNSRLAPATATALPDSRLEVAFDEPQFGVAPGQAVVCYDGDRVLGGGWIE